MTDRLGASPLFDPFFWMRAWYAPPPVAEGFVQPILPGWTFAAQVVNENNSSSPATESAIVAQESYGRQLGKLLDAVSELIERQGGTDGVKAFKELKDLRNRIEKIKVATVADHLAQIEEDLARLKAHDKAAYKAAVQRLRDLLP
jgi:hypothetical protein